MNCFYQILPYNHNIQLFPHHTKKSADYTQNNMQENVQVSAKTMG